MGSVGVEKPHAVCIPYPSQGHVNPLLKLAKILHSRGFYITFVNTEFNHNRLLRSRGSHSLDGLDDFRFETIPDGLPPSDCNATQDIPALCNSTTKNCLVPFRHLVTKLNKAADMPKVSCIVSDGIMSFALPVAEELGIPNVSFWTPSACGFMGYLHYRNLIERGFIPLKDESYLTNGYLDTPIDWVPGMKGIRLRDFPSFIRTTDPNDIMLNFKINQAGRATKASAVILNTFDDMERDVLDAIKAMIPNIYTIGPLSILCNQLPESPLMSIGSNLWKEDKGCLDWLDTKEARSVVFVNFGSITVMTDHQLKEFAWGLANSNHQFLWIIRPDLVKGESAMLPQEFLDGTKERGLLANWCPQEQVLAHPSMGGFLTHCGWNSTLESVYNGVPVICWPFFAEQQTNCRYACIHWGIGMEIDNEVKREEVEGLVREMMEGEKGKEMKKNAMKLKECAENAVKQGGSSYTNMEKLVNKVLCPKVN
ncbi:7-deoxyloganetin glucosyltransferase-like [Magnolia sinica]|uniref:7-deoxyloganetin glucosyltransferase-like n=1 Tax=Magnolia sinica TaxID=86752 RepID=UPI00265A50D7|nr:7-deoxyloganetin glucosyltransferase-like [Magnolia sinica]